MLRIRISQRMFPYDKAPENKASSIKPWFTEELQYYALSPDLNLTERLRGELERRLLLTWPH